jgi:hypothetical protein
MVQTGGAVIVGSGGGMPNDATVELVAVTNRGQRFVGQGHWYER